MQTDFQKLYDRYNETKQYKDRWLALYKDLYYYVLPDRDAFNVKWNYRDDGKPTTLQVWDNTAIIAAYQRANDLHGLLMPKDRDWGSYQLSPQYYSQDAIDSLAPTVDEVNDRIRFYLGESNLARVVSSSNLDLVGGTGALWVESIDDDTPLYYRSVPAVCLYVEYSTDDVLNTAWYQCKMTGRQVRDNYPQYRGMRYQALIEEPNQIYIVIFGQIKLSENKFYLYAIMEEDPFYPLWERDSDYPQLIIYRDRVRPGEADGRGIGLDLLPTIKDLNQMVQYDRQSVSFKAYPPMFVDTNSYFNAFSVRQWAGTLIQRNPGAKRNPIEAMQMPDNPHVLERIMDLRDVINRAFMVEPLGEIEQPVKSATEVSIRENRAQRTASVDISRLINELPRQVFEVAAKILAERRLLSKDKKIGAINTKRMRFVFESPLFDLQKQDDLSHFVTNMQIKQQFWGQEIMLATVNLPEAEKSLTKWLNLKSNLFKSSEEVKQLLAQMAQAAQQQETAQPQSTTGALPQPQLNPSQVNI